MSDTLDDISHRTLEHYSRNAQAFFAGTIDHDVSQNIAALLGAIEASLPTPSSTSAAAPAAT